MKILVICQYYTPEPFRHPDICEELVKRGHDVTVVTGLPNYPMGEICEGYRHGKKRNEVIYGVKVHRCFTVGRKHGIFRRFLNYYSYAFSSTHYVKHLQESFDVVFVNQLSPVMMARAGLQYKKKHKVPLILYCLDLWPESLIAGGIKRGGLIYRFFHKTSARIYRQADRILVASRSFSAYFEKEFHICDTVYLPQYAESVFDPVLCQKQPDGWIDLMFAGNVGTAQSVDTILKAARLTTDIPNLRWHIVGDGSELERLKKSAEDLPQVIFHGRKPLSDMPAYYAMADAMLVTMQKDDALSLTLPGKVQTYMAAGKPIIGAIDGEAATAIQEANCGLCSRAEDAEALAKNIRQFLLSPYTQLGQNASDYYKKYFQSSTFISRLESCLR